MPGNNCTVVYRNMSTSFAIESEIMVTVKGLLAISASLNFL